MKNALVGLIAAMSFLPSLGSLSAAARTATPVRGVTLSGAAAKGLFHQCSRESPRADGWWKVSPRDVQNLEAASPRFWNAQKPKSHLSLTNYYRQYAGFRRQGRKMIYLNACEASMADKDWKTQPMVVCDGGDGFFGVEYDVQLHMFRALSFNGPG